MKKTRVLAVSAAIILLYCTISSFAQSTTNETVETASRADAAANANSLWLIQNLPRYGGDSELNKEDLDEIDAGKALDNAWVQGIIFFAALALLFPLISFIICPFWCLCRCCNCCCCKPSKKKKSDLRKVKLLTYYYLPLLFLLAACCVMVVIGGLAYNANTEFSDVLLYRNQELNISVNDNGKKSNLWNIMINVMENGEGTVENIRVKVDSLKPTINDAIVQVSAILAGTGDLRNSTDVLINMLGDISALWNDYNVTTTILSARTGQNETYNFPCGFCTTIATEVSATQTQISSKTVGIFADLKKVVDDVELELVAQNVTIMSGIDDFSTQIVSVRDDMKDLKEKMVDNRPEVEDYNSRRELAYNVLFAVPLTPVIFIVLAAIIRYRVCFSLSYIVLWLSSVIMFALLGLHLPIAVLLNDGCDYLDIVDDNVTAFYDNELGKVIQACLDGSNLTSVLGLDGELNFTESIKFPSIDVASSFSFTELDSFESSAIETNFTTFHATGDKSLTGINSAIAGCINVTMGFYVPCNQHQNDVITRDNYMLLNVTNYYPAGSENITDLMLTGVDVLIAENATITEFSRTVELIQANISSVKVQANAIENQTQAIANDVDGAETVLDPVFVIVDEIIASATCTFIGNGYYDIRYVMCEDVLGTIARIVVGMIIIGIIAFVSCCCAMKMVRRTFWLRKIREAKEDPDHEHDNDFVNYTPPDNNVHLGQMYSHVRALRHSHDQSTQNQVHNQPTNNYDL